MSVAVVTGGGRGIGAAVARVLAARGDTVWVAARSGGEVEAVAKAIGGKAHLVDVSDPASVQALKTAVGEADILVNNAGVAHSAPLPKITIEDWNRLFAVNATGTMLCTQAFLPGMVERKRGRVVNIASIAGITAGRYIAAYAASKHAVLGFTRSVAAEVAASGVTINAVCPSYVDTAMTKESIARIVEKTGKTADEARNAILSHTPQGRMITPEEVADTVLWLCGDGARGVNGQAIVLDGGGHRA